MISIDNKNYNATREKLILPEYGRNVLTMVGELLKIEDKAERSKQAQIVINVMGNINPTLRDSSEYSHKLWDHLHVMADFALDIDAPYETPSRDALNLIPERLVYKRTYISQKQYGDNIKRMIQVLCENKDKEGVRETAIEIVKFMRQKSYDFNLEYPSNEIVVADFNRLSNGVFDFGVEIFEGSSVNINNTSRQNKTRANNNRGMAGKNNNHYNSGHNNSYGGSYNSHGSHGSHGSHSNYQTKRNNNRNITKK